MGSIDLLLADNIIITDWEGQAVGKANVLKFYQQLFDNFKTIVVDISKIGLGQDTVLAEINLTVDGQTYHIVDVLDYDQDDKIKFLRAYKR